MEFATEIGQNLLAEVRRLQSLLGERDKALEKFVEERDSWDTERNVLVATVRSAESSVGELACSEDRNSADDQNVTRRRTGT